MNLLLKQRLVGTAVIIALGVVIIPILLDGSGSRIIQEIPPRLERQSVPGTGLIKNQAIPRSPNKSEGEVVFEMEPKLGQLKSKAIPAKQLSSTSTSTEKRVQPKETGVIKTQVNKARVSEIKVSKVKASKAEVSKTKVSKASAKETSPSKVRVEEGRVVKTPVSDRVKPIQKIATWVVQVGSFAEKNKAINLRDQLRKKGFTVFMEPFKNSRGEALYRVRVGPVQNRNRAEVILEQLKKKTRLENGYVTQT